MSSDESLARTEAKTVATAGVPHLRRVLSLGDLFLYGIVSVTPSAPITVFGLALVKSRGHAVDTILIAMVAMLLTAVSYGRMAAVYPSAGSAYAYVGRGLNAHLGFLAGWAMLLDYLVIPTICAIFAALTIQRAVTGVPYVVWVGIFAGTITFLNLWGIRATARTNQILVTIMGTVLVAFIVLATRYLIHAAGWAGYSPPCRSTTLRLSTSGRSAPPRRSLRLLTAGSMPLRHWQKTLRILAATFFWRPFSCVSLLGFSAAS